METYYIRHTADLDIDDATRQRLWDERRIAVHYPHYKSGEDPRGILPKSKADNSSLDLDDYPRRGRTALRALTELAASGGYVCAEHYPHSECVLGYVAPGSKVELFRGKWGSEDFKGREAILKSLRLQKVKLVRPADFAVISVGRLRQGTIMRWRRAGKTIENAVEGRTSLPALSDLSSDQQEIMCSEFLRLPEAAEFHLPKLAHLLLPVGRTMKGVDICGVSDSGKMIFAQVTYLDVDHCDHKKNILLQYGDNGRNVLVLFCNCTAPIRLDGIHIVPLRDVYHAFVKTVTGKAWLERASSPLAMKPK